MSTATQLIQKSAISRKASVISVPVYQTATVFRDAPKGEDRLYRTSANLPLTKLNKIISNLDQGNIGVIFGSGSTLNSLVHLLQPGNEVIGIDALRTYTTIEKHGIKVKYVDPLRVDNVFNLASSETRLIWIETHGSALKISEIAAVVSQQKPNDINCAWIALLLEQSYNCFVRWELTAS